ncbi:sensor domain-containing diguanylate cyclase [Deinococcus roseus]|uniref:Diguanylate cyclase n=1 Tax=Deinococcus roseus TaxID=392414 RepID=A0ABQ2D207_9DEIO|nr:sensor domain-containing diguanylate cyclase [Deinococcus roseus]GGJ38876.1 hypothetical protein GCM10008938_26210 [Deinococcus roseus]
MTLPDPRSLQCILHVTSSFELEGVHWLTAPQPQVLETLRTQLQTHPEPLPEQLELEGQLLQVFREPAASGWQVLVYPVPTAEKEEDDVFSLAFKHASIGMALVSPEGRWLTVNDALCKMLKYSRAELLKRTFQDITHPDDLETDLGYVKLLLEKKIDTYELIKRYITRFGEILWIKLNVSMLTRADGTPEAFVAQIQDVSETLRYQDHLEGINTELESTHKLARVSSFKIDVQARTITFSRSIKGLLGYYPGTLSVSQLSGWFTPESYQAFQKSLEQCLQSNRETEQEVAFLSPAQRRWVCRMFPRQQQGSTELLGMVQDVTKERQQEEKIRDLEARWQLVVESNQDGLWDWDARSEQVYYSSRWKEILGCRPQELPDTEEAWRSRVHPEDLSQVEILFQQHLDGKTENYNAEYRMLHKNGLWIWISERGNVVSRSPQGKPLRVVGTIRDVTRRRASEQALQQAQRDLQATIDHVPAMMGYWDRNLQMRFANQAYLDFFQMTLEEIHGKPMLDVIGEVNYQHNLPHARKALQGEVQHFQRDLITHEGTLMHTQASYIPDVQDGEVQGFFVLFTDVTPLVGLQRQLQESESRYRLIAQNATDMISLQAPDGVFRFVSPYSQTLLGYTSEELVGTKVDDLIFPEDRPTFAARQEWMKGSEKMRVFQYRLVRKDGSTVWAETSAHLIRDPLTGHIMEVQASTRDISERKQDEALLLQALEYSNALTEISRLSERNALPEELAREALTILGQVCRVDWAGVVTLSGTDINTYTCWQSPFVPEDFQALTDQRSLSQASLLWQVMERQQAIYVDDYLHHAQALPEAVEVGVRATALLPLVRLNELQALFFALNRMHQISPWTPQDRALLEAAVRSINTSIERQKYTREMEHAATRDSLTGLLNRRSFHQDLQAEISRAERHQDGFGLLNIDLDGLKKVNDLQGHSRGDQLISSFGHALRAACRREDRVYRLGGDEYMVILASTSDPGALHVVEQAVQDLQQMGFPEAGASVGFAAFPRDGKDAEALMHTADGRMYAHKNQKKQSR